VGLEPAVDLAAVMAVVSCLKNQAIPPHLALFGEVGLSGEVRSVSQPLARIKEAVSLGFHTVVLPKGNLSQLEKSGGSDVDLAGVSTIKEALGVIF
jgi:DNA repair protein RadA/Sms